MQFIAGQPVKRVLFCVPEGVTIGQMLDVYVEWLHAHPADRHMEASTLFYVATRDAFPCPKK